MITVKQLIAARRSVIGLGITAEEAADAFARFRDVWSDIGTRRYRERMSNRVARRNLPRWVNGRLRGKR